MVIVMMYDDGDLGDFDDNVDYNNDGDGGGDV